MAKVFLVEDNDAIREAVASYLKLDDHQVYEFPALAGVTEAVAMQQPDILVLDVMLPDGNGFQLARDLRKKHDTPILFLTARTAESDRITGFEVGGDDYLVKPFSPKELCLRVAAILKRTRQPAATSPSVTLWHLEGAIMELDKQAVRVSLDGRPLNLTGAEWKILEYLSDHPGQVLGRDKILGHCLDYIAEGSERTIDTHIKNLRAKLGSSAWIRTVRGFGYSFSGGSHSSSGSSHSSSGSSL